MKQKIKILFILSCVGTINFIFIFSFLVYPLSPFAAIFPLWISIAIFLLTYFIETVIIIRWQKVEIQKFKTFIIYYLFGLLLIGLILFIRDYIPSTIFRKKEIVREQEVLIGRDIFSKVSVGKPKFFSEKNLKNTNFDEFYFYVDIPIYVSKSFTKTQILNAFVLRFNGISLDIRNCNASHYRFEAQGLTANSKQNQGTYTIRFIYSYYGKSCSKNDVNSLLHEKVNLSIDGGKNLKTFTIDNIEFR